MSLQVKNKLGTSLRELASHFADKTPILEAMGLQLVSITKRNFSEDSMRPTAWAPHKYNYGGHSLLRKSGALWQSIRITSLSGAHVTVGTDRVYAAMQQFGGKITPKSGPFLVFKIGNKTVRAKEVNIPARPFFPFSADGQMTQVAQDKIQKIGMAKMQSMMRAMGF
jgi:phage gpG-like protein